MSKGCGSFHGELERAIMGSSALLAALADHPHARACAACRAALERERRLERVLAQAPAPEVPADLARRVLAGLAGSRSERSVEETPDVLEELLERVPAPRVPAGLAARVIEGVASARTPRARRRPQLLVAAAALVLAGASLWYWSASRQDESAFAELAQAPGEDLEADEELVGYAVEHWDLLHDDDLDVWLASLDPLDALLIEFADGEGWLEGSVPAGGEREGQDVDGSRVPGSGEGR